MEPLVEGAIEEPRGLRFGELLEGRVHARFHRTRAQNLGAKAVNRADGGFFQRFQGLFEVLALTRVDGGGARFV